MNIAHFSKQAIFVLIIRHYFASLAQLVEQLIRNEQVEGSNPLRGSKQCTNVPVYQFNNSNFCWYTGKLVHLFAEVAQLVEHQLPKLRVAGPNPVFRS